MGDFVLSMRRVSCLQTVPFLILLTIHLRRHSILRLLQQLHVTGDDDDLGKHHTPLPTEAFRRPLFPALISHN